MNKYAFATLAIVNSISAVKLDETEPAEEVLTELLDRVTALETQLETNTNAINVND